jgi:hypothetical protein
MGQRLGSPCVVTATDGNDAEERGPFLAQEHWRGHRRPRQRGGACQCYAARIHQGGPSNGGTSMPGSVRPMSYSCLPSCLPARLPTQGSLRLPIHVSIHPSVSPHHHLVGRLSDFSALCKRPCICWLGQVYYEDHKRLAPGITNSYVMKVGSQFVCYWHHMAKQCIARGLNQNASTTTRVIITPGTRSIAPATARAGVEQPVG